VDANNSMTARLGFLLRYLDNTSPDEGWDQLYDNSANPSFPTPIWEKLEFMGHSQGAGHAAYLAQTKPIQGAIMVSGPQDECINCPEGTNFWIDGSYMSSKSTAFASAVEPLYDVMKDNWKRMTDAGATTWTVRDNTVRTNGVGYAFPDTLDVCDAPYHTYITPATTSTCGGKDHCSTAIDDSVPFVEKSNILNTKRYLYANSVWPSIARDNNLCE